MDSNYNGPMQWILISQNIPTFHAINKEKHDRINLIDWNVYEKITKNQKARH